MNSLKPVRQAADTGDRGVLGVDVPKAKRH
jgi:hypothetical protein